MLGCPRCGASFRIPETLASHEREDAARIRRIKGTIAAISRLRQAGATLPDAKAIAQHVTTEKGSCHRCAAKIPNGSETTYQKCRSLKLDW
jgi:hypothetical protein